MPSMKQLIGWAGRAISYFIYIAPAFVRSALGAFLGWLWFDLFRIRRKVVLDNLKIAFPEKTEKERIQIGRRSLRHMGLNFVEYALWPFLGKNNYLNYVEFHNQELMDAAIARGKGVLMLTCHLGHGDMALAGLSLHGYDMYLVSKFFKLQWLNDLWFGMRERMGTHFIAPRNSSYALLKSLKRGGIVTIPLDQFTGPPIGVRTTFFGRETGTAAGLALMAQRSKAPVILTYTYRNPQGKQAVTFVKEVPVNEGEALEVTTQRFNDELEPLVRQHADQWMWIHKRWKTFKY